MLNLFSNNAPNEIFTPSYCIEAEVLVDDNMVSTLRYKIRLIFQNYYLHSTCLQVMMIIYLKVSISDFLTVFAARTRSFFFTRRPGLPLVFAAMVALGASTLLGR